MPKNLLTPAMPAVNKTQQGFLAAVEAEVSHKPVKLNYVVIEDEDSLSYSKLEKFYQCPRKYEVGQLKGLSEFSPSIHTAFGHAIGAGVQEFLLSKDKEKAVLAAIAAYDHSDIELAIEKANKSLWFAISAIDIFSNFYETHQLQNGENFSDYEVAILEGKPAIELTFYIKLEGYNYQGHIDLVLRHKLTGRLVVFEIKTSKYAETIEDWKNSNQALGYNVVLNNFVKNMADYRVIYLCYNTLQRQFYTLEFIKTLESRTEFLLSLLADVEQMNLYKQLGFWPKRGTACKDFNRPCEYFDRCDNAGWIETQTRLKESGQLDMPYEALDLADVTFVLDIKDLLESQQVEANETPISNLLDSL